MSDPILALLQSPDPTQRKKGIGAAAKTADKRYLPALAQFVKTETDPELRELAKKAGSYIHKQSQVSAAPPAQSVPAAPTAPPVKEAPRLADLITEPLAPVRDAQQAQIHYDKAFEMNLRGDNASAVLELGTALYLDSRYMQDKTTAAFAAELTGLSPAEAVQHLADPDNWRPLVEKHGGIKKDATRSSNEWRQLILWGIAGLAGIILFGIAFQFVTGDVMQAALQEVFSGLFGGGR